MDYIGNWQQKLLDRNYSSSINCRKISEDKVEVNGKKYRFDKNCLRSEDHSTIGTFRNGDYIEWRKESKYFATWMKSGDFLIFSSVGQMI